MKIQKNIGREMKHRIERKCEKNIYINWKLEIEYKGNEKLRGLIRWKFLLERIVEKKFICDVLTIICEYFFFAVLFCILKAYIIDQSIAKIPFVFNSCYYL